MGDLDELPALLAELRGLVRDAHAAIKDLGPLLREHRRIAEDGSKAILAAMEKTVNEELRNLDKHLQAQMNLSAADLNESVTVARKHIVTCLTPHAVTIAKDGKVQFDFRGNFDQDAEPNRNRTRRRP